MPSVTIIIPVYKKLDLFAQSFINNKNFFNNSQVIIINDDPEGGNLQNDSRFSDYKNTIFIQNDKNLGFAKSVNKAVNEAKSDFVMLLNTDVFLKNENWQKNIEYFIENPKIFAISFAQEDGSGKISGRNKLYFKDGLFHHKSEPFESKLVLSTQHSALFQTAWAEGGSAIFRKSMWDELHGFDENFSPFYWEDVDLSYRASKNGWQVYFSPDTIVLHKHESTIGSFFDKKQINQTAFTHQIYFTKKHANNIQKIQLCLFLLKQKLRGFALTQRSST